jgi:surfeit locus 1 family protein
MGAALGAARPAPTFLMLQTPAPSGFGPTPMALPLDIPNNHLGYAVTWFGLALTLAGVYLAVLWRRRSR